jgi:hypothetical protein
VTEAEYFEDDDETWVYACLGTLACDGLLRIRPLAASGREWEWLHRSSTAWDAAHQKIYRNCRATLMEAAAIDTLPQLPEGPPIVAPAVERSFESVRYLALTRMLRASECEALELHVVLCEDTYESFSGDGRFHDFEAVRLTAAAAREYVETAPTYCARYYHRRLRLSLEGDFIRYDLQKELFDCCDAGRMLNAAEVLVADSRVTDHV